MNNLNGVVCLLTRKNRSEFLWVKRQPERDFMGGYFAFVGGGLEPDDENLTFALARELFEELGILVTTDGILQREGFEEREKIKQDARVPMETSRFSRKIKQEGGFRKFLNENNLNIDNDAFRTITDWKSGEEYSKNAYIRLFELEVDDVLNAPMDCIDEEATFAEWTTFEDAIAFLDSGKGVASALVRALLVNFSNSIFRFEQDKVLEDLTTYKIHDGIYSLAMRSHTLPPSTTTNCVIFIDDKHDSFLVIDPGGADRREQDRLLGFIGELIVSGLKFLGVALTHHHHDHHAALPFLLDHLDCKVFGHAKLGQRTEYKVHSINDLLDDLDVIETPGHSDDHLAFYIPRTETIIGGDMIASKGSILIAPEHGNIGDYLNSLKSLLALDAYSIIPSHGSVVANSNMHLRKYISHREKRHQNISKLMYEKRRAKPIDLVSEIYTEIPTEYYPLAALSVESHLLWMCENNELRREGDFFSHHDSLTEAEVELPLPLGEGWGGGAQIKQVGSKE